MHSKPKIRLLSEKPTAWPLCISDSQESADIPESIFDQILEVIQFSSHLPSLYTLQGWQLPLWCQNMPFGNCTGIWGTLLNYPKNIFFSCTFILLKKKKKDKKKGEGDVFKGLCWCSDVMFDWLRFGFKRMSAHSKNNVFYCFMWGSNRIIYNTSIQTVKQTFALTLVCTHTQEITFFL